MGEGELGVPAESPCEAGEIFFVALSADGVTRYDNGDLLYSTLVEGHTCFDPGSGTSTFEREVEVIGGTGSLQGATGSFVITGTAEGIGTSGLLSVFTGSASGLLIRAERK